MVSFRADCDGDVLSFLVGSMGLQEHDRVGDATFDAIIILNMKHNEDSIAILNTTNYSSKNNAN